MGRDISELADYMAGHGYGARDILDGARPTIQLTEIRQVIDVLFSAGAGCPGVNQTTTNGYLPRFEFAGNATRTVIAMGTFGGVRTPAVRAVDATPRAAAGAVLGGLAAIAVLLAYPELALALYVVVGDVKGDERVAGLLPWDFDADVRRVGDAGISPQFAAEETRRGYVPGFVFHAAGVGHDDGRQLELHAGFRSRELKGW